MKIASLIVPFKDTVYRHEDNIMQVDSALFEHADDDGRVHEEDDEDIGKHAGWKKISLKENMQSYEDFGEYMKILDMHHSS